MFDLPAGIEWWTDCYGAVNVRTSSWQGNRKKKDDLMGIRNSLSHTPLLRHVLSMSCLQSLINPLILDVIQRYCLLTSIEVIVGQPVIHSFIRPWLVLLGNPRRTFRSQPFSDQSNAFIAINFSNNDKGRKYCKRRQEWLHQRIGLLSNKIIRSKSI